MTRWVVLLAVAVACSEATESGATLGQDASPAGSGGVAGSGSGGAQAGAGGLAGADVSEAEPEAAPEAEPEPQPEAGEDASDAAAEADAAEDPKIDWALPCDWPARFAKCSTLYPTGAAVARQCVCFSCGYAGCPTCQPVGACGGTFCQGATGDGLCMGCLDWYFSTWAVKCQDCSAGSQCAAFVQCVTVPKNC